jgi:hypothetical protein
MLAQALDVELGCLPDQPLDLVAGSARDADRDRREAPSAAIKRSS